MAFNRDFSNVNQAIQRMMSFYLQNKLGELSNERYMDTIAEQDRLMRERSAQEDALARGRAKESYGMDFNLAIQKGIISAINDPALDSLRKQAQLFDMAGDTERANQAKEAFASKVPGYINAAYVANTGKRPLSETEIMDALMATDTDSLMTMIKEGGVNRRFEQELPIQKQQAATSAGNLALSREQFGLEKEKFGAEQGRPGMLGEKQKTQYIDTINKVSDYLISQGVVGENSGSNYFDVFGGGSKTLNPMSAENQGKTLTALNELRLQIIKGGVPTPNQEAFLSKVWNVPQIQKEGVPSMQTGLTPNETTDAETRINQNIEALVTNQIMQRLGLQEDRRDYARQLAREFLAGMK
jgi:hypothetical protein